MKLWQTKTPLETVVITALGNRLVLVMANALVGMEQILPETCSPLTDGRSNKSPSYHHSPTLISCGSSSLALTSSTAPCSLRSSKTGLPHIPEKPWTSSGHSAMEKAPFQRGEVLGITGAHFSWLCTLEHLHAAFNCSEVVLAAAAVLKHGSWSCTTDLR